MLRDLGGHSIETSTMWTNGEHRFEGVRLDTLLHYLNVDSGTFKAVAVNDYAVTIPVSEALEGDGLVAYEMDGQEMSVREKGPLWIVYPYDSDPTYQSETYYSRSIWQMNRLIIGD
jgi:hypothetical protein